MILCVPIALLLMITLYFVLTRILFPNHIRSNDAAKKFIHGEYNSLGRISVPEIRVLIIFSATAFALDIQRSFKSIPGPGETG